MTQIHDRLANRYVVLETLGRGGMGEVYRVFDEREGYDVALKRLTVQGPNRQTAVELFEREFLTLSQLAHPRIVAVYDYGVDIDGAYYTMELLSGEDVRALGKVPWRRACELLRDVASSLAILHSRRLLHNDVSPRNVRCTIDGRAKLMDFGAMAPMGVNKSVVGTPPFIAPETLNQQSLDGRTDLYSLGALAYWLMTGTTAYPADDVRVLRDWWRRPPASPHVLVPEIPVALSDLVLELLQLNRNVRPRSAAVVMERLCAIAGLEFEEAGDVARAYVTTPVLVGRDEPSSIVRERLLATVRGTGGVVIAAAPGGGGRSRFLDACVLEAKLLGLQVIRIDPSDAVRGDYGAASSLCRQLFELAPSVARDAMRVHAPVLAHVLGAELASAAPASKVPERRQLLASLRDFVLSTVRSLRVMLAVDGADEIDEVSSSLLSTLAQKLAKRSVCIVLTIDSARADSVPDALADCAQRLELAPLTAAQTEQLMASVFGDARNLVTVAQRVHAIAAGNPRAIMQLITHLVDEGVARYEAGSFVLPERLRDSELPPSLNAALAKRISSLDSDALELAQVLALTDPTELPAASYRDLTGHGDQARTRRALDTLLQAQVIESQGARYRLSDPTWTSVLSQTLTAELRFALHARLARAFEQSGTLARRSYHWMESQQPEAAIRLLLTQYLKDPNEPRDPLADYVPGMLDQLERAALEAERLNMPAPWRMELRMKACGASQFLGDLPRFKRMAPSTLAQLMRDSCLEEYQRLDSQLEPLARLTEAFTRTQQRYDATPVFERGLPPTDAIRELSRLVAMCAGVAQASQDSQLLESLPSLQPFVVLSPAVAAIQTFADAARANLAGRERHMITLLSGLIVRLSEPDGAGLGQLYCKSMRLGAMYIIGIAMASAGAPDAYKHVAELESEPGHRVNAQRVRMICQLMQGDAEAASDSQRRAELMTLQDGSQQRYPGSTARGELLAYWLSGDLAGLKQLMDRIEAMVARYPATQVLLHLARGLYRNLQGDPIGALSALEPALAVARPGEYREWAWVAAAHVQALVAASRVDEAVQLGTTYAALCHEHQLSSGYRRVAHATAEALVAHGNPDEALTLANELISEAHAAGTRGIALGAAYELRARAAAACGDDADFHEYAAKCAAEYRIERNTVLAMRYQRLLRDAARGSEGAANKSAASDTTKDEHSRSSTHASLYARLLECRDAQARATCALTILCEHVQSEQAYLFGLRDGRLGLLCGLPNMLPANSVVAAADYCLTVELDRDSHGALSSMSDSVLGQVAPIDETTAIHTWLLASRKYGELVIAGVVALVVKSSMQARPTSELMETLASALVENDDVDPATCII